ncbi:MAG: adenylosuccinate synthetase [Tumebacillaceae bacterium]
MSGVRSYDDLPENAKAYIRKVEESTGVKLAILSVGPGREQTIPVVELYESK